MKNLLLLCAAVVALCSAGCSNLDQNLVRKMQADLDKYAGQTAGFGETSKAYRSLIADLSGPDDKIKNSEPYMEARHTAEVLKQKTDATVNGYNDLLAKLGTLLKDYTSGKSTLEATQKEYELLSKGLENHKTVLDDMAGRLKVQQEKVKTLQ